MVTAVACFAGMAACVKLLREQGMSTAETVVYRMAPGLPWLWLEMRLRRAPVWPRRGTLVAIRTIFGGAAMGCSFFAVQGLTLLQHMVLHLAQPVFVAGIAPPVLRERLRGAALVALALALGGALVVIRPDQALGELGRVSLLFGGAGLAAAVFSAFAHLAIRMATGPVSPDALGVSLARAEPDAPETLVFHFALWISLVGLVSGLATGGFRELPTGLTLSGSLGAIGGMAGMGVLGQLLMSRAYARWPAPRVALIGYAGIPMSVAIDAVAWGAPVTASDALGAMAMVVAGVLLLRDR